MLCNAVRAYGLVTAGSIFPLFFVSASTAQVTLPTLDVIAATPAGSAIARDRTPSNSVVVTPENIARSQNSSIAEALQNASPSVSISNIEGNPFQPQVEFRGFIASATPGTPQGLAVYQNGVRINEVFSDVVNWDFIPASAIANAQIVTGNPVFGLNALGGAVTIEMKNGFTWQGFEIDSRFGSNKRLQTALQLGRQSGSWSTYLSVEGIYDGGWRRESASRLLRAYADIGYRAEGLEAHVNFTGAKNYFGAAAFTPMPLLAQNWNSIYTNPQTFDQQVGMVNLQGNYDVSNTLKLSGNLYYRGYSNRHGDGNVADVETCSNNGFFSTTRNPATGVLGANPNNPTRTTFLCQQDDAFGGGRSAASLAGTIGLRDQNGNLIPASAVGFVRGSTIIGSIDRTAVDSRSYGSTLQATSTSRLFDHDNQLIVGGSVDSGNLRYSATSELGTINTNNFFTTGSGLFYQNSQVPGGLQPVRVNGSNRYLGLYALDAFDVTKNFTITAGGRLNVARVDLDDKIGTRLTSSANYARFNPMLGATYRFSQGVTLYAGYSEANRAPTAYENSCADAANPCILQNFLASDPPLKQVVSRSVEFGARGSQDLGSTLGTLAWKAGYFNTRNVDDILTLPSLVQGHGYFANVGRTKREGVELGASLQRDTLRLRAEYALVDATFQSNVTLDTNDPSVASGTQNVRPGNVLPGVPKHRVKLGFDWEILPKWQVGLDYLYTSSSWLQGNESNRPTIVFGGVSYPGQIPGYGIINFTTSYKVNDKVEVYGLVNNLLNKRYVMAGAFYDPTNIGQGVFAGSPDPRTMGPGQPIAAYAGMKVRF